MCSDHRARAAGPFVRAYTFSVDGMARNRPVGRLLAPDRVFLLEGRQPVCVVKPCRTQADAPQGRRFLSVPAVSWR